MGFPESRLLLSRDGRNLAKLCHERRQLRVGVLHLRCRLLGSDRHDRNLNYVRLVPAKLGSVYRDGARSKDFFVLSCSAEMESSHHRNVDAC